MAYLVGMNSPLYRSRGFSLIEMIIVLLISVLGFAAISSNISSGNESTKIQAAARDIASALRYAHGQALMGRQPVSVAINLDDNSYRVSNRDKIYELPTEIDVSLTVAEEELEEGDGSIRFFGDGSSTGGRIVLEWGKQRRQIDVNWITGEVAISALIKVQDVLYAANAGAVCGPALPNHKDVANVEIAGAYFHLPPASMQSSVITKVQDVRYAANTGEVCRPLIPAA
jgi:general secretion pathway protein H